MRALLKSQRLHDTLKHRPMDSEWEQITELLADILHWCDQQAYPKEMSPELREKTFEMLLREARQSYDRHHCIYCHDETEVVALATVCEGHAHLARKS